MSKVEEIKKGMTGSQVELGNIPEGGLCKIGDYEFIVLEHSTNTTEVLLKDLLHEKECFGKNNNYDGSNVDKLCDTFYEDIAGVVGADAFIEHEVDLTSDDGLKDYGLIIRKMSLLTAEQYRQYVDILDNYNPGKWWWLATPYSTPRHEDADWAKCVSPRGSCSSTTTTTLVAFARFCTLYLLSLYLVKYDGR